MLHSVLFSCCKRFLINAPLMHRADFLLVKFKGKSKQKRNKKKLVVDLHFSAVWTNQLWVFLHVLSVLLIIFAIIPPHYPSWGKLNDGLWGWVPVGVVPTVAVAEGCETSWTTVPRRIPSGVPKRGPWQSPGRHCCSPWVHIYTGEVWRPCT